jgi:hypothetical protein
LITHRFVVLFFRGELAQKLQYAFSYHIRACTL